MTSTYPVGPTEPIRHYKVKVGGQVIGPVEGLSATMTAQLGGIERMTAEERCTGCERVCACSCGWPGPLSLPALRSGALRTITGTCWRVWCPATASCGRWASSWITSTGTLYGGSAIHRGMIWTSGIGWRRRC